MKKFRFFEIKCINNETGRILHIEDTTKCNPHMVFYLEQDVDARIAELESQLEYEKQSNRNNVEMYERRCRELEAELANRGKILDAVCKALGVDDYNQIEDALRR